MHDLSQGIRRKHFDIGTVTHDIHNKFRLVGIGNGQGITAVFIEFATLT